MEIISTEYPEKGRFNITIKTKELIHKESVLSLSIATNVVYFFNVTSIYFDGNEEYEIIAKCAEYGYYKLFSKQKGFDYRTIIGCVLELVTDEDILNKLRKENSYC